MTSYLLTHVPSALLGVLFVATTAGVGVGGLLLVRRRFSPETLERHNDVAGVLIAMVGGLYGVLLAFVVTIVWQQFEDASGVADGEAVLLLSLYRDAASFPAQSADLRADLERYAHSVVDSEWKEMSTQTGDSRATDDAINSLQRRVRTIEPQTPQSTALYEQFLSRLARLEDARQDRLFASGSVLPGPLWLVLVSGGLISISFTYFFGLKSQRAHMAMVGAIAASIGLTLFVIVSLDLPFTGDVSVKPTAMQDAIAEFAHVRGS